VCVGIHQLPNRQAVSLLGGCDFSVVHRSYRYRYVYTGAPSMHERYPETRRSRS
jgi:hypothetical protein